MDLIPDSPTPSSGTCSHMYSYGLFKKMNYVCYVIVIKIKGFNKMCFSNANIQTIKLKYKLINTNFSTAVNTK
jgi:hypothetical protein